MTVFATAKARVVFSSALFCFSLALPAQTTNNAGAPPPPAPASSTAQSQPAASSSSTATVAASENHALTVPAGTQIPVQLRNTVSTKTSRPGDPVFCQTTFPVVVDNVIVIPSGTYVRGVVNEVKRGGRIRGRAEILFHFTTLIYPSGYTVDLPGTMGHEPGAGNASVADDEGTVKADSQKGKDAETIGKGASVGSGVGAIATRGSLSGAGAGAGIGGLAGVAAVLLTRGQDVTITPGASLEMVLQRPLTVDVVTTTPSRTQTTVIPRAGNSRLSSATTSSKP